MITKLFDPDARLGHWFALSISLTALAGCGGIVVDSRDDGGKADSAPIDSAIVTDTSVDTFGPIPVEDSSTVSTDAMSPEACNECVQANCAAEVKACEASPECLSVAKCVNDCGDDATCANACLNDDSKPGVTSYVNVLTCAQDKCSDACF